MKTFLEVSSLIENSTIILDVDGTLVNDKNTEIPNNVLELIKKLSLKNKVYLCSNGSPQNAIKFANIAGVDYFSCFKPFKRGAEKVIGKENILVVGDKFLTDGLFALNIGAEFIKVDHLKSSKDSTFIKFTYLLDDLVWSLKNYLVLMRPWQWIKNLLVIAPVFFANEITNGDILFKAVIASMIFSIFSSATYIFNDIFDLENDRNHPKKKNRPIAKGTVSLKESIFLAGLLIIFGLFGLYLTPSIFWVIFSYVILNILYTLFLKNIAILDSISVAFCYVLRILAGGLATGVYISPWIVLCVFFGSLFVVFGKRVSEFNRGKRRSVLDSYSKESLSMLFTGSAVTTVVVYAVWSILGHHSNYLIYSTIFVAIALFRLLNIINKGNTLGESPEILVFKDRVVLLSFLGWFVYVSLIFYGFFN